ncbi:hypothetical protein RchiOBHm_Chr7g0227381 [Rosa chinensis]|uniref:Uncharacterized protein n=1 Tax=Rosa chinensis TaxID=74649 RepID=A0A2P6PEL3_ROSCH|nr:hypothetical protein RchiOBHm_Chr7g0227381 [Rosa chinensis]
MSSTKPDRHSLTRFPATGNPVLSQFSGHLQESNGSGSLHLINTRQIPIVSSPKSHRRRQEESQRVIGFPIGFPDSGQFAESHRCQMLPLDLAQPIHGVGLSR